MAEAEDKEEDYGLIRPTLIKTLRSILDQYPDDGQILKELIQNAEDAGARHVKFLYDDNSYGTSKLHHPDMAQFQGPALFAYNDAQFSEEDWKGIRMLQDSVKEKDPMKVGRFGLGFKSVLHMTDLPSVLSGERLQMIDPHEKYFTYDGDKSTGYRWHLREKRDAIRRITDQFEPYQHAFGCSKATFEQKACYDGTLFRFPLRSTPSALSDTLYTKQKMEELFASFQPGAHTLLLFLKNLESVELLKRVHGQSRPESCFSVAVTESCRERVRQKRREFSDTIRNKRNATAHVTYVVDIETLSYTHGQISDKHTYSWLVNEYYAGGETSQEFQKLCSDTSLGFVPLVGTAMPIETKAKCDNSDLRNNVGKQEEKSDEEKDADTDDSSAIGQIFCFLPLPVEQKSSTGLPVHVNGYFSISQNRRHLKWPTAGHSYRSDKALMWNQCLLQEAVPKSYTYLIRAAIVYATKLPQKLSADAIYAALPNIKVVDQKWQVILQPLFNELFKYPMFYTPCQGGKWLQLEDCLFDCMREEAGVTGAVREFLLSVGSNVSKPPHYVFLAIGAFSDMFPENIDPSVVRRILQRNPSYQNLSRASKLAILTFILKDETFEELHDLRLLPVSDESFVEFRPRSGASLVYMCTENCSKDLLPGLENKIVPDVNESLSKKLKKMAQEGHSNLKIIDPETTLMLLHDVIPSSWKDQPVVTLTPDTPHVSQEWLRAVWVFLRNHYPGDLRPATELPLLPLDVSERCLLVPLKLPSSVISVSMLGTELPPPAAELLQALGIHVVRELPEYVMNHGAVIGNYVRLALETDVLEVIQVTCEKQPSKLQDVMKDASEEQIAALISVFCKLPERDLTFTAKTFIQSLPLFELISPSCEGARVCVNEVQKAAPDHDLPITLEEPYLKLTTEDSRTLARKLGVMFVSPGELLVESVLPKIQQRFVSNEKIQEVMKHVLENIHSFTKDVPGLYAVLANVPFVVTSTGHPMKPSELFDPESRLLQDLFADENLFPCEPYSSGDNLILLRKMQLKDEKNITAKDFMYAAMRAEDMVDLERDPSNKSHALLQFLCKQQGILATDVNTRKLSEWLQDIAWVPVLREKIQMYPNDLPWMGSDAIVAKPRDMVTRDLGFLGSHVVVCAEHLPKKLSTSLGFVETPQLSTVVSQLQSITQCYNASEKAAYMTQLSQVYECLSKHDVTAILEALSAGSVHKWVWTGEGFSAPERVFMHVPMDLRPYAFPVPAEVHAFSGLFIACGVQETCETGSLVKVLEWIRDVHAEKSKEDAADCVVDLDENGSGENITSSEGSSASARDCPDVGQALQLAVDILNKLGAAKDLTQELRQNILIPVNPTQDTDVTTLTLLPVDEVTYCDVEWMRKGLDVMHFDAEEDGFWYMHDLVPLATAHALHLPTLLSRMLHAQELDITGFGQSEQLTERLKKLLDDYTDGLSIPKELIQNADDAHATEVSFLYDERTHADQRKYLLDEGMRQCQGPALWVHNNATFTDKDFDDIIKLGGATKEEEVSKIGKFGLGFNAVYNITDVPSFVSRDSIVIFDPHTTHLGRAIRDRSKPGIRINIQRNKTLLRKLSHQFAPYENVFGCEVTEGKPYDGTLFRLPLRTEAQARLSAISSRRYDHSEVLRLLGLTASNAHHLLLFTQNVLRVRFYHLREGEPVTLLYEIKKEPVRIIRQLDFKPPSLPNAAELNDEQRGLIANSNFLTAVSHYIRAVREKPKGGTVVTPQIPQSTLAICTLPQITPHGEKLLGVKQPPEPRHWLISSCMGQGASLNYAQDRKYPSDMVPIGGVALPLSPVKEGFVPRVGLQGQVFCYLPLPMMTGLPVHVNGAFAISSSRRTLVTHTKDDKDPTKAVWNKLLQEDAVVHAYMQMLQDLTQLLPPEATKPICLYNFWPRITNMQADFKPVCTSFYKTLGTLPSSVLTYSNRDVDSAVTLKQSCFLDMSSVGYDNAAPVSKAMIQAFNACMPDQHLLEMPRVITRGFEAADCEALLKTKTYTALRFYKQVLLPNIEHIQGETREVLLVHALNLSLKCPDLKELLCNTRCIPTQPDGTVLKRPAELVRPGNIAAMMYDVTDHRFPHGALAEFNVLKILRELGMTNEVASWEDLLERTRSVAEKYECDVESGRKRLQHVLAALDRKISSCQTKSRAYHMGRGPMSDEEQAMHHRWAPIFRRAPFLPTLQKPDNFPMKWLGDSSHDQHDDIVAPEEVELMPESDSEDTVQDVDSEVEHDSGAAAPQENSRTKQHAVAVQSSAEPVNETNSGIFESDQAEYCPSLMCAEDLYPYDKCVLVSATQPILDSASMTAKVRVFLNIDVKQATVEQVITQAQHALQVDPRQLSDLAYDWLQRIMGHIYTYLQDVCKKDEEIAGIVKFAFSNHACILLGREFVKPENVSFSFFHKNCSPYLYGVPDNMKRSHRPILEVLGVKAYFSIEDYTNTLQAIHTQYGQRPLDTEHTRMCTLAARELSKQMEEQALGCEAVENEQGVIYLPNSAGVLHPASSLCSNDCAWVTPTSTMNFVHKDLTLAVAERLGVKTKRQTRLKEHSRGLQFGQRGSLISSIRRVIEHYPADQEILKELIQNADDAGATEIHFVLDPRQHPSDHVFEESWKPLQGPALLVYNNTTFTEADLEGIQMLGEGSKRADPCSTGQFGIGFCSVYHLTDAPSILTTTPELGQVLCVFDPQCLYVPDATPAAPGMMYDDIENMQNIFPDVFNCYMPQKFSPATGTTFRFPLRTAALAEKSKIWNAPVDVNKVADMLLGLKKQLFDILLFTKSVRKVSVMEIDTQTNQIRNQYSAIAHCKDATVKTRLCEAMAQAKDTLRKPEVSLNSIPRLELSYRLEMYDSEHNQEEWCVSQRLGLPDDCQVPDTVSEALQSGKLALLPCGGTAVRLKKRRNNSLIFDRRPNRLFCSLPLPVEISLPVHINGHFALSSESRKTLYVNSEGGQDYKQDWNELLFQQVVAPSYVNLLLAIRFEYLANVLHEGSDENAVLTIKRAMLENLLSTYQNYFPVLKPDQNNQGLLDTLIRAVYHCMADTDACVLPCIKEVPVAATPASATSANTVVEQIKHSVKWFPPNGKGPLKAFFCKEEKAAPEVKKKSSTASGILKSLTGWMSGSKAANAHEEIPKKTEDQVLKEVLLECGFILLAVVPKVVDSFIISEVDIDLMSPEGVIKFFKTHGSEDQCCDVGPVPCNINQTAFQKSETLKVILRYCKGEADAVEDASERDAEFANSLDGTPLMLTNDECLKTFESTDPVFYSEHFELLPKCGNIFLSGAIRKEIFKKVNPEDTTVFKPFGISDLAERLELHLEKEVFFEACTEESNMVEWSRLGRTKPSDAWMKLFWTFVRDQVKEVITVREGDEDGGTIDKGVLLKESLEPLEDWALIPVSATVDGTRKRHLTSFQFSTQVLLSYGLDTKYKTILDVLKKLELPDLRIEEIEKSTLPRHPNLDAARHLVASPERPESILVLLQHVRDESFSVITEGNATSMLIYFMENLETLRAKEENAERLVNLPFFKTVYGDLIPLAGCHAYTIPARIPTSGIEVWQSRHGTVFLERNDQLTDLYDFLDCKAITPLEVYRDFIFQHFEYFEPADRAVHLRHVYNTYIKANAATVADEEQEAFREIVKDLPFIEDEDGDLMPVSAFYDPENPVFQAMLPASSFPPEANEDFDQGEWYDMLRELGLIQKASKDMFVKFTKEVAGGNLVDNEEAGQKSMVLTRHLFEMDSVYRDDIIPDICSVPFIRPDPVTPGMSQLAPQYHSQDGDRALPNIAFEDSILFKHRDVAWSSAKVLPTWADPSRTTDIAPDEREQVIVQLGINREPPLQLVARHLSNLCESNVRESRALAQHRLEYLRKVYNFLQRHEVPDEVRRQIRGIACVPVEDASKLVNPKQTALVMLDADEICPYLYKVPAALGEFHNFFQTVGAENAPTISQYVNVLYQIKQRAENRQLHPNEMMASTKATRGLFNALLHCDGKDRKMPDERLYLLSDKRVLVDVQRLVYNDCPSFYERVPNQHQLKFLLDLRECNIPAVASLDPIRLLPVDRRPQLLSELVRECLVDASKSSAGLARELEDRIKSDQFRHAIVRLVKHNAAKSGRKISDVEIEEKMRSLSSIELFAVRDLKTHLIYEKKAIAQSETRKTCFESVRATTDGSGQVWEVYVEEAARINHDLLIPLSEVINRMLGGILKDSVLYLIPLLSSRATSMNHTLNQLNIKEDHSTVQEQRVELYPQLGEPISEAHRRLLQEGARSFREEEWAGFQESTQEPVRYCKVMQKGMNAASDDYVVSLGGDLSVARLDQLFKFDE